MPHLGAAFCLVLMVTMLISGSGGECDHGVVSQIVKLWQGNPPTNVLAQMEGVFTYISLSPEFMSGGHSALRCVATILDPDHTSTTGVYIYDDTGDIYLTKYNKSENQGKITISSPDLPDESQYIVSLEGGVLAFYQCMHTDRSGLYKPLFGIAVSMERLGMAGVVHEVEAAERRLAMLGFTGGIAITPCDPNVLAIV